MIVEADVSPIFSLRKRVGVQVISHISRRLPFSGKYGQRPHPCIHLILTRLLERAWLTTPSTSASAYLRRNKNTADKFERIWKNGHGWFSRCPTDRTFWAPVPPRSNLLRSLVLSGIGSRNPGPKGPHNTQTRFSIRSIGFDLIGWGRLGIRPRVSRTH